MSSTHLHVLNDHVQLLSLALECAGRSYGTTTVQSLDNYKPTHSGAPISTSHRVSIHRLINIRPSRNKKKYKLKRQCSRSYYTKSGKVLWRGAHRSRGEKNSRRMLSVSMSYSEIIISTFVQRSNAETLVSSTNTHYIHACVRIIVQKDESSSISSPASTLRASSRRRRHALRSCSSPYVFCRFAHTLWKLAARL